MAKATKNSWYSIKANAEDSKAVDVNIYDAIGAWGITAKQFIGDLLALEKSVETIHVHLNSPGGDVFDGIAIYDALKTHKAKVHVYISGLAASIASIIALSGDKVFMSEDSYMMIHPPSLGWWTADELKDLIPELQKDVELLDKIQESLVAIYVRETGNSKEDITAMVNATTWLDASECKSKGFIDEVSPPVRAQANLKALEASGIKIPDKVKQTLNCTKCSEAKAQNQAKPASFMDKVRNMLGMSKPRNGAKLSAKLNAVIDSMVTDSKTRDSIIQDMVDVSGQTREEVDKDIDGSNNCPALKVLASYCVVLTCTLMELKSEAEADGCEFETETEEQEDNAETNAMVRQLYEKVLTAEGQLANEQKTVAALKKQLTELGEKPADEVTKPGAKDRITDNSKGSASGSDRERNFFNKNKAIRDRKAKTSKS